MPPDLGHGGSMMFIKLRDGRVVATNDLWNDKQGWVSAVSAGALTGWKMSTRVSQHKSKEALSTLFGVLKQGTFWRVKSGLSDAEAHALSSEYGDQLPQVTMRIYQTEGFSSIFASPENAIITHVKIGEGAVESFEGP
jgi:hypothetical protein